MELWHLDLAPPANSPRMTGILKACVASRRSRAALLVTVSLGLTVPIGGDTEAYAASPVSTGLASPPAWAAGRRIHFYPSPAASGFSSGLSAHTLGGGPPPIKLGIGPILYNEGGGGVEHSPHIYAIFWGSNWNAAPGTEAKTMVLKLFEGLSNTAYQGILTQYFDSTGRVGKTVAVTSYTDTSVTAPSTVNDAKIQAEVTKAIETNSWTAEINNQFVVLTAPSSTYATGFGKSLCGYHGLTKEGVVGAVYAFVPYQGDEPFKLQCTETGDFEKSPIFETSTVASHEYAEMATDPDLNTWHTPTEEVADICRGENNLELPDGAWAQNLQDNHLNNCVHEDLEPPFVYAITKIATEITATKAKLEGVVNPEGLATTYIFEWGTTKSYGNKTSVVSAGSTRTNQAASATISGLTSATEYHYRLVATNSTGTTNGLDKTFKTS
jgi:hypothetical protein